MMNQRKIVFPIIVVLHCSMYSMENVNTTQDSYYKKELAKDLFLNNVKYNADTKQYFFPSNTVSEKITCQSILPTLDLSRGYAAHSAQLNATLNRYRQITQADRDFLDKINTSLLEKKGD